MPLSRSEAQDLVEHFGGYSPAAKATGENQGRLWALLHPEVVRARDRARGKSVRRREQIAQANRRLRERRLDQGICSRCGKEPRMGEALCWTCLNDMEANRAIAI